MAPIGFNDDAFREDLVNGDFGAEVDESAEARTAQVNLDLAGVWFVGLQRSAPTQARPASCL